MSIDLLLRLLARLLPPLARARYLEEWRADLVGSTRLGLPRTGVLVGAAALLLRIDRDRPEHSGLPRGALPRRLARRGAALVVAAGSVVVGRWLTGGLAPEPGAAPAAVSAALVGAGRGLLVLALVAGVVGALLVVGAGVTARTRLARVSLLAAVAGLAATCAGAVGPFASTSLSLTGSAVLLIALVGGFMVLLGTVPLELQPRRAARGHRVPAAVAGLVLLLAVVVLGGIDVLVWNPMVKVPGRDLASIYTGMVERDHFSIGANVGSVAVWAVFWTAAGVVVLIGACMGRMSALTPRRVAILMLGLVSAAVFFRFFAGFGIGMSIADSFGTDGRDASLMSALLAVTGQLALAGAAIAFGWAPRVTGTMRIAAAR